MSGYSISEVVNWKFIPPGTLNFEIFGETGVESFKYNLKREMRNANDSFLTVITQIEGILNSHPFVPSSSHADDLNALTPGNFLIGRKIKSNVELEVNIIYDSKLKICERTAE